VVGLGIEDLRRKLDESIQALGKDDPGTLIVRRELAHAYYQAGEYVEAFTLNEEVLAGVTRLLGADDRITVSVLTDLAHVWLAGWLADQRPELAIPLFEFAVAERMRVTGANDPGTLTARNDLATAYLAAGQPRRAIATFDRTLLDCTHVLGDTHSVTRLVRDNLDPLAQVRDLLGGIPGRDKDDAAIAQEMVSAFAEQKLASTMTGGRVSVTIPAIGETLSVAVCDVKRITRSFAPTGDAAVELAMVDGDDVRPLIILAENVVFAPEDPDEVFWVAGMVVLDDAPTLTSYVDMLADAERFAAGAMVPREARDRNLAGKCVLTRCKITSAVRLGMRPLSAVAWWQRGWQTCRDDLKLPPFAPDPVWAHLVRSAEGITLTATPTTERAEPETKVEDLTVTDFEALGPRLSAVGLDDEFVEVWKKWIPVTPAKFAELLTARLSEARAEVAIYPSGTGSIDLILEEGGEVQAIVQLSFNCDLLSCDFDFPAREMRLDEIRIGEGARGKGLFQILMYNITELVKALGLKQMSLTATGIGSYAFAKQGWPQDYELYLKANPSARRSQGET
jgi:hypothetical protein